MLTKGFHCIVAWLYIPSDNFILLLWLFHNKFISYFHFRIQRIS